MIVKKTININKKYKFSHDVVIRKYKEKILVIFGQECNWLVLDNIEQLKIFELLKKKSIKHVINSNLFDYSEVQKVVAQIEAKQCLKKSKNKRSRNIYPSRLQFYLTNKCNLNCPHCYMFAGEENESELDTNEVIKIIRDFARCGGKQITFTGGEVKVLDDFLKIIETAYESHLKISVFTNGTLWNSKQEIEFVAKRINEIQISIDGFDEISNSKVRGSKAFSKSLNTLREFSKFPVKLRVACTPCFEDMINRDTLIKYIRFSKQLLDEFKDKSFQFIFSSDLLDGRNIKLNSEEKKLYAENAEFLYDSLYGDSKDNVFIQSVKNHEKTENCAYGNLSISSTGDVYFCGRIPFMKPVANVKNVSMKKIMRWGRKAIKKSNVANLKPCSLCELRFLCGGDCRIKYFSAFTDCEGLIKNNKIDSVRFCDDETKNRFYDLMIRTNKYFFK